MKFLADLGVRKLGVRLRATAVLLGRSVLRSARVAQKALLSGGPAVTCTRTHTHHYPPKNLPHLSRFFPGFSASLEAALATRPPGARPARGSEFLSVLSAPKSSCLRGVSRLLIESVHSCGRVVRVEALLGLGLVKMVGKGVG